MSQRARRLTGLVAVAVLAMTGWALPQAQAASQTVHIFTFNDFHGRIDSSIAIPWAATLEQAALADPANSIVISGGDNIGASLFNSFIQQDEPTITLLNDLAAQLNFKASVVGNHEFDGGFTDLTGRVIPHANFKYLGANVIDKTTNQPALDPYYVYTLTSGLRIGVVGAVTQETPTLVSPGGVANLNFTDPVAAVNQWASYLKTNNLADIIVADYHEGAAVSSSLANAVAATNVFKHIVEDTNANVAAIITGHTHLKYAWKAGERPVIQTGSYGDNVGQIDLVIDTATMTVTSATATNIPRMATPAAGSAEETAMLATGNMTAIKAHVDAAVAAGTALGNRTIAKVSADITTAFSGGQWTAGAYTNPGTATRDNRAQESDLATLVADAFLDTAKNSAVVGGADIGIVNAGGGLRQELLYGTNGLISYAQANAILPFANNLWTFTLTGAQIKGFLEEQWQTDAAGNRPSRPFLNTGFSSNVTYTVNTDQPDAAPCTAEANCGWSDSRSHITSVYVNGKPLEAAKEYKIITISFLVEGGDNYRIAAQGKNAKDTGLLDRDAWVAYLMKQSGVTNPGDTPTKAIAPNYARPSVVVSNQTPTAAPMAAAQVKAGSQVSLTLSRLNLTSLGSPANTGVTAYLRSNATTALGTALGNFPVTAPGDTAGCTTAGVPSGLSQDSSGCAKVTVTVPAATATGAYTLVLVAQPSGTTVSIPLTVATTAASQLPATGTGVTESVLNYAILCLLLGALLVVSSRRLEQQRI